MDSHSPYPALTPTQAIFQSEILEVHKVLRELSPAALGELMDISPRLADVSWQYHQALSLPFTQKNALLSTPITAMCMKEWTFLP